MNELTDEQFKPEIGHPAFIEGYMAGTKDPGFVKAFQPDKVANPYPENTNENFQYEAGYRAAIE